MKKTKIMSWVAVGLMAVSSLASVGEGWATMTAANLEKPGEADFLVTRVGLDDDTVTVMLRNPDIRHISIAANSDEKDYTEGDLDYLAFETMTEGDVEWGRLLVDKDTAGWPLNTEIKLKIAGEGKLVDEAWFGSLLYYSVKYENGEYVRNKAGYHSCKVSFRERLMNGLDTEGWECRLDEERNGTAGLVPGFGEYVSPATEAAAIAWDAGRPTRARFWYQYSLNSVMAPVTGTLGGVKPWEEYYGELTEGAKQLEDYGIESEQEKALRLQIRGLEQDLAEARENVRVETVEVEVEVEKVVEVEVEKVVEVEKIVEVEKEVEKIVEVEKPVLVEKIVEIEKPVVVEKVVEVEKPVIVEKVVEMEKPVVVEKIVEIEKPVVVEKIVEVEKPVIVEKVVEVEKPVITEKVVEVEKPIVTEKVVEIEKPVLVEKVVEVEKPVVVEKEVVKTVEVPVAADEAEEATPALGNTSNQPWWVLMPTTAAATALVCWWTMPEKKWKQHK